MKYFTKSRLDYRILLKVRNISGFLVIILGIVWKFGVDFLIINFSSSPLSTKVDTTDFFHVFIALFIAPPLETLFFQLAPIELFDHLTKKYWHKRFPIFAACFSAIIFGSVHSQSLLSVMSASVTGLALSNTYLIFRHKHHSTSYGYIMTVLLHFTVNLIINLARLLP